MRSPLKAGYTQSNNPGNQVIERCRSLKEDSVEGRCGVFRSDSEIDGFGPLSRSCENRRSPLHCLNKRNEVFSGETYLSGVRERDTFRNVGDLFFVDVIYYRR